MLFNYVSLLFIATTLATLFFLYKSTNRSLPVLIGSIVWLAIQAAIGLSGFYQYTDSLPPRFLWLMLPPILAIVLTFLLPQGRRFIDKWHLGWLGYLHVIRISVEMVLYELYQYQMIPKIMTFEGRNFDILSGFTAPIITLLGFKWKLLGKPVLLAWNIISLGLLLNVVVHAILSAPSPFQQLAFDHPNVAVLYFPYIWLPCFIVPVVLMAHLVTIRRLILRQNPNKLPNPVICAK